MRAAMQETEHDLDERRVRGLGRREGPRRRARAPLRHRRLRGHPLLRDARRTRQSSGCGSTSSGSRTRRSCSTWSCRSRSRRSARRSTSWSGATGSPSATSARSRSTATASSVCSTKGNPVEVVVMSWPWGNYLGDENAATGIRCKISSWKRIGANTIPHVAKATGIYLNSMLAVHEAQNAGYDEAILLTDDGFVADGSGENIFVVKDGKIWTPPLSTSILPGITRDSVIQIAQDLGYVVEEASLIRSDLYLADEIFMTGTAAEVMPVRVGRRPRDRRRPGHARAAEGVPRHRARQVGPLGALARPRRGGRQDSRPAGERESGHAADSALVAVCRRARRGARARGAPVRASLARAGDRPLRGALRGEGRSAVRGRRLVRHVGAAPAGRDRRPRGGRRGDHVALLVRRLGELLHLRRRDARFRRRRRADDEPRSRSRRGRDHGEDEGDRRGRHLRLPVRARPDPRAVRDGTA